jgi:phage baseplate assembly protein W
MSSAGGNTNELLSDHPSDATRISALQKAMPTALKYYKPRITTSKKTTKRAVKKSANKRK